MVVAVGYLTKYALGGSRSGSALVKRAGRDIMLKNKLQHGGDESIQ